MELDRFRNQFALGPAPATAPAGGRVVHVADGLCLTAHRDLRVTVERGEHGCLALLGFMLDPRRPEASDGEVLERLLPALCPRTPERALVEEDFGSTWALGGRWALVIVRTGADGESALIHDAAGLRQVFHAVSGGGPTRWCASRASVVARESGCPEDVEARAFADAYAAVEDESWWPGTSTPFVGVEQLLPNHVLPLDGGGPRRYWPRAPLPRTSPRDAVGSLAELLDGTMRAAAHRSELVLGLTAGWDSRLALAASRGVRERLSCVTVRQASMDDDHDDLVVSARLSARLGVAHRVVDAASARGDAAERFVDDFLGNADHSHVKWAADVAALASAFPERPLAVSGGFAEAARNFYGTMADAGEGGVDAAFLLRACHMPAHPFALRHVSRWLDGVPTDLGYSVLDLFYWELRTGNWLAMCQGEFDPAWGDILTPYGNRELMTRFLGVDKRYRKGPWFLLHRRLVTALWPELMEEPINPSEIPAAGAPRARAWLKALASFLAPDPLKRALARSREPSR